MAAIRNPLHFEIIPGILEKESAEIEKKIEKVIQFAETIHIDLLDGKFADNTTFSDPSFFKRFTKDAKFEVHMMVENPQQYLKTWADAGFVRFIGQIEKMPNIEEFVAEGQMLGEVGLAVDIETPVEKILRYTEDLDFAFVMTVKAGFSNQSFDPRMLEKIGELRQKDELLPIEVDGGVNEEDITALKDAGATRFVSTGTIFGSENLKDEYGRLKNLLV